MPRIILFDVDNTLLYTGGAGSLAMRRAFERLYGIEDGFRRVEFSGRTDWAILLDALRAHELLDGDADDERMRAEIERFLQHYYELLPVALAETEGRVMPGVPELLEALVAEGGDARMGLATGNFREAAFMKLRHYALRDHLHEGGFGDDAEDRGEVVAAAIERVAGGGDVDVREVFAVGDTQLDVAAALANGAQAVGVATGTTSLDDLRSAGAELLFEDLSDTERVLRTLLG
jgi:phosphoglycolate phosphatase-like HAD superfamily hydrolase